MYVRYRQGNMPRPNVGEIFPDYEAVTTQGKIKFHDFIGDKWVMLFSHPNVYTPVCTSEVARVAQLVPEFEKRNVKPISLSGQTVEEYKKWAKDIEDLSSVNGDIPYPNIADKPKVISKDLGLCEDVDKPDTVRGVFIIGPDKKLKALLLYPYLTGRNFNEVLRIIDSVQLTAEYPLATPCEWKAGEKCMLPPTMKTEDAEQKFPKGIETKQMPSGKEYMRYTADPR